MASYNPPLTTSAQKIEEGVAALRAAQGTQFFWRRLHSLTGIIPVGVFLLEHILFSNATALNGPEAYANQVKLLGSLPLVTAIEAVFIWLPIAFHGLYGFYIWYRGDSNVSAAYPWTGNWMYTLQRWTGAIAFFYIGWHVWHLRFAGIDLHAHPAASFGKVQGELVIAWQLAFYIVGLIAASWHFSYGVWLFCAKWGITVGERARRRLLALCLLLFVVLAGVGGASLRTFLVTPRQPLDVSAGELHTAPAPAAAAVDKH
jgi:succinate dehydrogenase / fumarate reductase cytochrome b subunit